MTKNIFITTLIMIHPICAFKATVHNSFMNFYVKVNKSYGKFYHFSAGLDNRTNGFPFLNFGDI